MTASNLRTAVVSVQNGADRPSAAVQQVDPAFSKRPLNGDATLTGSTLFLFAHA
jgi:hypothetical protein